MLAQKHCKNIEMNSFKVFFPIIGGTLELLTFFCSCKSSDMELKENTDFGKNHTFRIFQNNPLKVILKFLISRLLSINFKKNEHFFGFFHGL